MTSPAIQLAIECGILFISEPDGIERFYARAQAQALLDAADLIHDDYGMDRDSAATLRRMAEELEK